MSKTKKPRNKKMSQEKKDRLAANSLQNNKYDTKSSGSQNLKMNNTNRSQSKVFRGASRGS
ncbi:hypothetical protein N9A42_00385 [bacterium]|jgi:hypothetical protein|nr:hypothetical protein [bacterium]